MTTLAPPSHLTRAEQHRGIGLLLGAAVGDALGAPFEFLPAGRYPARFPQRVLGGIGEMVGGGGFGWAPGEFTDDTQMGLVLAETLLAASGYEPDLLWQWFRAWAATANDVGSTTRASLRHPDWRQVPHDTARGAGNGALMRAFPLALAFLDADDAVRRHVVLHQAALTHGDPAAGSGAWLAVEMMCTAVRGGDPLARLTALLPELPDAVHPGFAPLLAPTWTPEQASPSNGTVWGCLAQAVWALRTTECFEDAVVAAVSLGDDTDTVACVTGALAGARYGAQAIPCRWTTYVHGAIDTPTGRRGYRVGDLQRLALQLLGRTEKPENPPEPPAGPTTVATGLHAADLAGASLAPTDWAVVSLCRTGDRFLGHPVRRQVFLVDDDHDHNHALGFAVREAADAVDAFLAEGRQVVVHCHGGRSRTGLVLKAWKMRTDGVSERAAHEWLAARWPRYQDYNETFREFLRTQW